MAGLLLLLLSSPIAAGTTSTPATLPLSLNLTFGIKHLSDFDERRQLVAALVGSIRARGHRNEPIVIAYEGAHEYPPLGALYGERYLRQAPEAPGLSAGRNLLVRHATTQLIMILDDDVLFHDATHVALLVAHLKRDPNLVLAAACHAPNDCYAHHFVADGQGMHQLPLAAPPAAASSSGLQHAHITHNAFVARVDALRVHGWDERQRMLEHEGFFLQLANAHGADRAIGFDPRVTVIHQRANRSAAYERTSARHQERVYFQYLCRNFPRIQIWYLPYFSVQCTAHNAASGSYGRVYARGGDGANGIFRRIEWDAHDDASTVVYAPPKGLSVFIAIISAAPLVARRDELRRSWLSRYDQAQTTWDYGFFIGSRAELTLNMTEARQFVSSPIGEAMLGDIVALRGVGDDYARLTLKVLRALHWSTEHVDAAYLLKVDEDTWVDAPQVCSCLHPNPRLRCSDSWSCVCHIGFVYSSPTSCGSRSARRVTALTSTVATSLEVLYSELARGRWPIARMVKRCILGMLSVGDI